MAREAQEKASRTAWARADISIKRNGTSMKLRNKKTGNGKKNGFTQRWARRIKYQIENNYR